MIKRRPNRNLAYEIGMCRIAIVVCAARRQMEACPQLMRAFEIGCDRHQQEAQLTYFWWVLLGGNSLKGTDCQVAHKLEHLAGDFGLFQDWLAILRGAAAPVLGEELTRAWIDRIECLIRQSEAAPNELQLAKAS